MSLKKRREFLKESISASLGLITANQAAAGSQAVTSISKAVHPKKIIVGGGGIAGLCCGYELMKKGHDVTVMEASGRHGGHVYTAHDGLSDGLYADCGQEHITKPGYDLYWKYINEFGLEAIPKPSRRKPLRRINGKFYTEDELANPKLLQEFGFNAKEIAFLSANPWWALESLYIDPYLEKFTDEYQPFGVGYDELDKVPFATLFKQGGASAAALEMFDGNGNSALFGLWESAIRKFRGISLYPDVYRLKDGNQKLPDAFAKKLGERVWLNSPVLSVANETKQVTVTYKRFQETLEMKADYFVNCIPLTTFRKIPVTPAFSAEKQHVLDNVTYSSYQKFVFQASSKFWLDDGLPTINMTLGHPDLGSIWHSAEEVNTHRIILLGTGPGGVSAQRALAAFREVYPGKKDTIEQVITKDWTKDPFAADCERLPFPIGELHRFWPEIMKPAGRIHFAGAYADNLWWGTEAATRSANRVANTIDLLAA